MSKGTRHEGDLVINIFITVDGDKDVMVASGHSIATLATDRAVEAVTIPLSIEARRILEALLISARATVPSEQLPDDAVDELLAKIFKAGLTYGSGCDTK